MSDIESPAGSPARDSANGDASERGADSPRPAAATPDPDASDKASDAAVEDDLSEIDDEQFEDYDPETAKIEDRPVEIDEDVARTLKVSRRKRTDADKVKKPKEGRREKKKRPRDGDAGGEDQGDEGARPRKNRRSEGPSRGASSRASPERDEAEDENLTPEERRRRALDRALDAAVKGPTKRRKKRGDEDLDDPIDDQIAALVVRMERACEADNTAREAGRPAVEKTKLLPEVVSMLGRNVAQEAVLDPDSGFLRAVRYFLEPLNDGSLPAYSIQREIFNHLVNLPIEKDALLGSGLGKVVFFYTKSKKPQQNIKRIAEKLVGDWSRPILKRTDDYKKRFLETRTYDYQAAKMAQRSSQFSSSQPQQSQSRLEAERERALAPTTVSTRARLPEMPQSYTVAPQSTFSRQSTMGTEHRPIGSTGIEAFRKMTQKPRKRG
ncbi:related to Transcription factor IWS1 [Cephalotrichum gorgonifer]|uniref:Related to Transcription factor IWS1 n=1 Tax=Cephalotrichum gorgonifer TaxID=2041049 RepID=A0AAE8SZT7_9PEZI|nr:related to Transcription factor IWS1 [Cephalotrichum gorgonifer]